jgi:hypothetical protein
VRAAKEQGYESIAANTSEAATIEATTSSNTTLHKQHKSNVHKIRGIAAAAAIAAAEVHVEALTVLMQTTAAMLSALHEKISNAKIKDFSIAADDESDEVPASIAAPAEDVAKDEANWMTPELIAMLTANEKVKCEDVATDEATGEEQQYTAEARNTMTLNWMTQALLLTQTTPELIAMLTAFEKVNCEDVATDEATGEEQQYSVHENTAEARNTMTLNWMTQTTPELIALLTADEKVKCEDVAIYS